MLMLSGIGPKEQLSSKGINVVVNSPNVGKNMMDHIYFGPAYATSLVTTSQLSDNATYFQNAVNEYVHSATGPLTVSAGFIAFDKFTSKELNQSALAELSRNLPDDWPHFEYVPSAAASAAATSLNATDGTQYASLAAALVAPFSRGEVTLASNSAFDKPLVNPNYLSHPIDQLVAVASVKKVRSVAQAINSTAIEVYSGSSVSSDAEILSAFQLGASPAWHTACSARMGTNISNAVADGHGRVFGVKGLRVVDASAFPILPPDHPDPSLYALAELERAEHVSPPDLMGGSQSQNLSAHETIKLAIMLPNHAM